MRGVSLGRGLLGAAGLALIGIGAWRVAELPDPVGVVVWLGGALVLHDGVIAPLVLGVGLGVAVALPAGWPRGVVRGALVAGGVLVLVTLPVLVRPGVAPNATALPLPYGRNLLLVLGGVVAVAGVWIVCRAVAGALPRAPHLKRRRG